jgi:hypothetical protein
MAQKEEEEEKKKKNNNVYASLLFRVEGQKGIFNLV